MIDPRIFKAYDVRGIYPSELGEDGIRRIGQSFAAVRKPKRVAVGGDVRLSTPSLKKSLIEALTSSGADVVDLGTITTDQLYFAVGEYGYDGGLIVTASHNPRDYNGVKFIEAGGGPVTSADLAAIRDWALSEQKAPTAEHGRVESKEILGDYLTHVLSFVDPDQIKPLRIVANANHGPVGYLVDRLAERLHLELTRLYWEPDGSFPQGQPNPLLPANRAETIKAIKEARPDFAVAWDSDADRCLFFTADGTFIPGSFITALLAQEFLRRFPGAPIVYDLSHTFAVEDTVRAAGGRPVVDRVGHTFIKEKMRSVDAPFGGEMAGHYYFRDNFYADNGLVPFLMVLGLVSESGKSLSELLRPITAHHFVSDELNFPVSDTDRAIDAARARYSDGTISGLDGLSVEYPTWRFNLRPSNTEPLLRLNVESRTSQEEVDAKVHQIEQIITAPSS